MSFANNLYIEEKVAGVRTFGINSCRNQSGASPIRRLSKKFSFPRPSTSSSSHHQQIRHQLTALVLSPVISSLLSSSRRLLPSRR